MDAEWTRNNWNPRFALIITPTKQDTIRLAAFRYRLPFLSSRMDPMDIGGIPVFRNFPQGSLVEEANLMAEKEWSSGFASISIYTLHQLDDGVIRVNNVDEEFVFQSSVMSVERTAMFSIRLILPS